MISTRRFHIVLTIVVCFIALTTPTLAQSRFKNIFTDPAAIPAAPSVVGQVQGFTTCQGSGQATTNNLTLSFSQVFGPPATAGDLLVVGASAYNSTTISTPAGYTQLFYQNTINSPKPYPTMALFYKVAAGNETGVTVNFGASTRPCASLFEFSGTALTSPLHGKGISTGLAGSGSPLGTGTIDIISPGDLGVALFSNDKTSTTSWTGSYSAPPAADHYPNYFDAYGGSSNAYISMLFADCVSGNCAGTTSTTISDNGDWRGFIASFLPKTASATTSPGANATYTAGAGSSTFTAVVTPGTFTVASIDPTNPSLGAAPSGMTYDSSSRAYNVSTTSTFTGTVHTCISIAGIDPATYTFLRLLHQESGSLVNRTTQVNVGAKTICGDTTTLSPFVVGTSSAPLAAGVSISGHVVTAERAGIRNATVILTDQRGRSQSVRTSAFGNFMLDDLNAGETYVLNVRSQRYVFLPRVINMRDSAQMVELVAQE